MGGSKATVFGGLICGAVAAAWLFGHGPGDPAETGTAAHHGSSKSRGTGWHWLPWSGGDAAPDAAAGKVPQDIASLGSYEGKRAPVLVRVIDDEGRPIPGAAIEVRVDRYQYADAIRLARPEPTPDEDGEDSYEEDGTEYEGTSAIDDYALLSTEHAGRDGSLAAKVIPGVGTTFTAKDRDGRTGRSEMVLLVADEDGSYYSDTGHPYPNDGKPFVLTIEVQDPGTLAGVVVDDRGHPIEGATVSVSTRGTEYEDYGPTSELVTDADGVFHVPVSKAGAFDLEIHAAHFQTLSETAVQVLPGRETELNLTLMPGFLIKGIVFGPGGQPMPGVTVEAIGQESNGAAATLDDGTFAIDELPSGVYQVQVAASGFLPLTMESVQAGGAPMQLRLQEGGHLSGEVFVAANIMSTLAGENWQDGEETDAVVGATVYVEALDRPGVSGAVNQTVAGMTIDRRGRGVFTVDALPAGRYRVALSLGQNWSYSDPVSVSIGGATPVSLRMPDGNGARVAGVVRNADGSAAANGEVYLQGALASFESPIDGQGHYEFPSVPPGTFTLRAMVYERAPDMQANDEYNGRMGGAYSEPITLEVGARDRVTQDVSMAAAPPVALITDVIPMQEGANPGAGSGSEEGVSEEKPQFLPDVRLEPDDHGLLVLHAPPGPKSTRLFPGDRVTSIDGRTVEDVYEALDWLDGAEGTICRITVDRPASHESVTVSLPRTIPVEGDEDQMNYDRRILD